MVQQSREGQVRQKDPDTPDGVLGGNEGQARFEGQEKG